MPSAERNIDALFGAARQLLSSQVSLVMDMTTYRGVTEPHLGQALAPLSELVVIHCRAANALDRFLARQAARFGLGSQRYLRGVRQTEEAQQLVVDPPQLDGPLLEVETTAGYAPDLDDIVAFVLAHAPGRDWAEAHQEPESGLAQELRLLGDQLRVLAETGLQWSKENPYDEARYQHVRALAAQMFALADTRGPELIEQELFSQLTHLAPLPVVDAAIVDDQDRILLIRRADDGLWAMPGGACETGETLAEGALREAAEEAGVLAEPVGLVGVYDSRLCGTDSSLQLYQAVILCRPIGRTEPTTPDEVTASGWFHHAELPPLSSGHATRIEGAFEFARSGHSFFDPVARSPRSDSTKF